MKERVGKRRRGRDGEEEMKREKKREDERERAR